MEENTGSGGDKVRNKKNHCGYCGNNDPDLGCLVEKCPHEPAEKYLSMQEISIYPSRRQKEYQEVKGLVYIEILKLLGMKLELVQSEQNGTRHYKDEKGTRLELYPDGSYRIELPKEPYDL